MEPKTKPNTDPSASSDLPRYEPPKVTNYTGEQLLETPGPAQAGSKYTIP